MSIPNVGVHPQKPQPVHPTPGGAPNLNVESCKISSIREGGYSRAKNAWVTNIDVRRQGGAQRNH